MRVADETAIRAGVRLVGDESQRVAVRSDGDGQPLRVCVREESVSSNRWDRTQYPAVAATPLPQHQTHGTQSAPSPRPAPARRPASRPTPLALVAESVSDRQETAHQRHSQRTSSAAVCSSVPKSFVTLHVYFPESAGCRLLNLRSESDSSVRIRILSEDRSSEPSFNQRNLKGGSPCDGVHDTTTLSPAPSPLLNSNGTIFGGANERM